MSLLAGLILAAWPAPAAAGPPFTIGFQNDTNASIYIEAVCNIRGRLIPLKPILINADKVGWQMNLPLSTFHFVVYDANKPSKRLFQGSVPVNQNLFLAVQPAQGGSGIDVVPAKPPAKAAPKKKDDSKKKDN